MNKENIKFFLWCLHDITFDRDISLFMVIGFILIGNLMFAHSLWWILAVVPVVIVQRVCEYDVGETD